MWPPAATLFVLDPRRMKTPNERFKCLGSIIVNLISYVVLFCLIVSITNGKTRLRAKIGIQ